MKKIVLVLFLLLTSVILSGCNQSGFPSVSERHKVVLSTYEAENKLSSLEVLESKIVKYDIKLNGKITVMNSEVKFNSTGVGYVSETETYVKQKIVNSFGLENSNIMQELYMVDNYYYVKMKMDNQIIKYKMSLDDIESVVDDLDFTGMEFDFNKETIENLFDETMLNSDFSGLSFYENGNKFSVRVELNDENASELTSATLIKFKDSFNALSALYEELLGTDISYSYLLIFEAKDDILVTVGLKIHLKSEIVDLKMEYIMTFVDSMPKLDGLDEYEELLFN